MDGCRMGCNGGTSENTGGGARRSSRDLERDALFTSQRRGSKKYITHTFTSWERSLARSPGGAFKNCHKTHFIVWKNPWGFSR
jgi:hypothetical protein